MKWDFLICLGDLFGDSKIHNRSVYLINDITTGNITDKLQAILKSFLFILKMLYENKALKEKIPSLFIREREEI
jgi:hypothetical protein